MLQVLVAIIFQREPSIIRKCSISATERPISKVFDIIGIEHTLDTQGDSHHLIGQIVLAVIGCISVLLWILRVNDAREKFHILRVIIGAVPG